MADSRSDLSGVNPLMGISAKLAAEILLGKIRLGYHQTEPHYLQPVRTMMLQLKKATGDDFDKMAEGVKPAMHALAAMLFDAVTGVTHKDTISELKKLPIPHRTVIESIVAHATGKGGEHDGPRAGRWADELWEIKGRIGHLCTVSVSNITPEEIREGYDAFMHAVVDQLYEHRRSLVS